MQTKVKVQTVPYISTAHCIALRSNADESRELYGTFGKTICCHAAPPCVDFDNPSLTKPKRS
jgi:hypothetical protein